MKWLQKVSAWILLVLPVIAAQGAFEPKLSAYPQSHARIGQHFEFRQLDSSLAKFGYMLCKRKDDILFGRLRYREYRHRKGTVVGITRSGTDHLWELELDNGETVYAKWSPVRSDQIRGLVFESDIENATRLIGERVYIKFHGGKDPGRLITSDPKVYYQLFEGDALEVLGIDTRVYGHSDDGYAPFFLKVKTPDGKVGLLPFSEKDFSLETSGPTSAAPGAAEPAKEPQSPAQSMRRHLPRSWR